MNCFVERSLLLVILAVLVVSEGARVFRQAQSSDGQFRRGHDGGQFPSTPPNFPTQDQNDRESNNAGQSVPNEGGVIFKASCPCPTVGNFNPVCGSNNKTYSNPSVMKCEARCTGTAITQTKLGSCASNRS